MPTWSTDAIPLPPGSQSGGESGAADLLVATFFTIQSLSAVSTSDIWAAGQSVVGATQTGQALVEHWNGAAWSIVPVQHAGELGHGLGPQRGSDLGRRDQLQ